MTTFNCSSNEELDFRLVFGEAGHLGPAGLSPDDGRPCDSQSLVNLPSGQECQRHCPSFPNTAQLQTQSDCHQLSYDVQSSKYGSLGHPRPFDCPSIQITSIAANSQPEAGSGRDTGAVGGAKGECPEQTWSRDNLYLSLEPCYRDSNLSHSPCSSLSSRSWLSDVSSCESLSHVYDDVEAELNEAAARFTLGSPQASPLPSPGCGGGAFGVELWQQQYQHSPSFNQSLSPRQSPRQSPCPSPRHSPRTSITDENWLNPRPTSRSSSRPTSPCGKRRHSSADVYARSPSPHHSPSPTPGHSPRGSVTEDTWIGSPAAATWGPLLYGYPELDIPSKTRRTSTSQFGLQPGQGDSGLEERGAGLPYLDSPGEECFKQDGLAELFLPVPSHFSWNKPKPGNTPLFRTSSLPSLEWPLPSQFGQCELKMEVQPRANHRAHYETEGSRGAIKAASGGHPVVKLVGYSEQPINLQVFIGTADDRFIRPHAFYQVHRVTGKTVSTACQENIINGTKVLEIPLLPESSMSTSIDCAGILKLRNSDIELRKGETDIGRKNTRVRVAFRVYIPQSNGMVQCLQAASIPIECSQRSAQELPHVERFSPACCSVGGGEEMTITGSNIFADSKVLFMEKGSDGRTQWEVDAKVIQEKSNGSSIVVEIPSYHNKKVNMAVQVQFYVSNGKRKRSTTQCFTYMTGPSHHYFPRDSSNRPSQVKQEHSDPDYMTHNPLGRYPTTTQQSSSEAFSLDTQLYGSPGHPVPCGQPSQAAYCPLNSSPLQHLNHLHSFNPSMGHQRVNPMQTGDASAASRTLPFHQNSQHSVPYSGQSSLPVRSYAAPVVPAQPKMAAPVSISPSEELMYQSQVSAKLGGPTSHTSAGQAGAHAPTQLPSFSYHCSLSGFDPSSTETGPSLSYQLGRGTPVSYSAALQGAASVPNAGSTRTSPSLDPWRAGQTPGDAEKHLASPHSLFSNAGEKVRIKQEPEEKLASMGLQEITLDDVNEIIDRDTSHIRDDSVHPGLDPFGWDQNSSDPPFCGGLR
ncbi:nuclear factor of activated T-cells, cytoplasmic 3-like isoform 1-T1 [Aplochiton taeniatus]